MINNIQLYKGDIPDNLALSNLLAIDCEFMGLNVRRDPLCLIQISSGNSDAHIIQFDRDNYNAPNLVKLLQGQESLARASLMEYECNQGDHSMFGFEDDSAYQTYQPWRNLRR